MHFATERGDFNIRANGFSNKAITKKQVDGPAFLYNLSNNDKNILTNGNISAMLLL